MSNRSTKAFESSQPPLCTFYASIRPIEVQKRVDMGVDGWLREKARSRLIGWMMGRVKPTLAVAVTALSADAWTDAAAVSCLDGLRWNPAEEDGCLPEDRHEQTG